MKGNYSIFLLIRNYKDETTKNLKGIFVCIMGGLYEKVVKNN